MTTTYDANIPYDSNINYDGGTSVVTPTLLPTFALKIKSKAGLTSPLPEAQVDSVSFEDSMASAISFKVAKGTVGESLVGDYSIVSMTQNGKDILDGRWFLRGKGWNAGEDGQVKSYTGKSLLWDRLERTTIQPSALGHKYTAKSPGFILDQLFAEAQARDVGYWDSFTWTFDNAKDSFGKGWPAVLGEIEYLTTAKYSDIVANMVDKGLIDIHLLGDEIQVSVQNSSGRVTPALLVVGKDLSDAPQISSADNILSHVTVLGDDGVAVTRVNPVTAAAYWREEGAISQGGTKDQGTLSLFGDVALSGGDAPRVQRTYGLVITSERPFLPIRDYQVGDWVRAQHGDESRLSVRVKQIVLKQDPSNKTWGGSLVLNDKFIENELRLVKKVDGIIGGATITGSAQTSTPDDLKDTGIPEMPDNFVLQTQVYQNNEGVTRVAVTATWDQVTTNTDSTLATDMATYVVAWFYTDLGINSRTRIDVDYPNTTVTWSDVDPGRSISAYVYAKDSGGHYSALHPIVELITGADNIAPAVPTGPALLSLLRTAIIQWDGKASSGQPMLSVSPDFKHIEIWSSSVNNFDPDTQGTYRGTMATAGQFYMNGYSYTIGSTVYYKFIAVDRSGNRSAPSGQNSNVMTGIAAPDIQAGAITANALAVGSVTAQAILAGAITADKISLGQTMNLVPDPSFNNADWRARRLTTEWSEKPSRWFFKLGPLQRNGYYLQALSQVDGVNGGRMYITGQIPCMTGETYYVGTYVTIGEFAPNAEATLYVGWEGVRANGEVVTGGQSFVPTGIWRKAGYLLPISDIDMVQIRFFVRADNIDAGDIAMDDWEVRSGVGTTETAGPRLLLTPPRLEAYNASEQRTVLIEASTGDVVIRGSLLSGYGGKRVEVNPGSTYLPEIRFYATSSDTAFAYINAVDGGGGTVPLIGVNAPDTGAASNAMILYDNGAQFGEITKATGIMTGPGVQTGSGSSGYLWLYGKLPSDTNRNSIGAYRFRTAAPGAFVAVNQGLSKPPAPPSGVMMPILSIARLGTSQHYTWNINVHGATSFNVLYETTPTSVSGSTLVKPNFSAVGTDFHLTNMWGDSD